MAGIAGSFGNGMPMPSGTPGTVGVGNAGTVKPSSAETSRLGAAGSPGGRGSFGNGMPTPSGMPGRSIAGGKFAGKLQRLTASP